MSAAAQKAGVVVATAAYPMADAWVSAFFGGLADAINGRVANIVVALDGVDGGRIDAASKSAGLDAPLRLLAAEGTPAQIRATMLAAAIDTGAEAVVLFDFDDVPLPDSVEAHCRVLTRADFSYGDMELLAENGSATEGYFFDGADVPQHVADPAAIRRHNFLGLTNTAVSIQLLRQAGFVPPSDIVAFDWWLFTKLLERGASGRRTEMPVVRYRRRRDAVLGPRPDPAPASFARRCRIAAAHAGAFAHVPEMRSYEIQCASAAAAVERAPERQREAIAAACREGGVWFSDVDRFVGNA